MNSYLAIHQLDEKNKISMGILPSELILSKEQFRQLWDLHPDDFHEVKILGRLVKTPRWCQAYGKDYAYSGNTNTALPVPSLLKSLLEYMQETMNHELNGLLVNWYDAKLNHYIGAHRDNFEPLVEKSPIVTVSFGEERIFRLRPWKGHGFIDFTAKDGSVFIMPYETNKAWKHEVPRSKRYCGRRISVTFRAFK